MRALRNVEEMENQEQNCKVLNCVLGFDEVSTDGTHCCPGKRFGNGDTCMENYAAILLLLQQDKLCKVWDVLRSAVAPPENAISWNETIT